MRRPALISCLVLCAALGAALTAAAQEGERPPECEYLASAGTLRPWGGYGYDGMPVFVSPAGPDVVDWGVPFESQDGFELLVVQHCGSGRELAVALPRVGNEAAVDRWARLINSSGQFTLQQLAAEMERRGGKATMHAGLSLGTCACDAAATW